MAETPKELREIRKFGDEEIEVIFRKVQPLEHSQVSRYPPLVPCMTVENGIRYERDVALPLRDGTIIYIDIYRPDGATNLPAIIAWSPAGKRRGYAAIPIQLQFGLPPGTVSPMAKFESADPAYWCHHGYAVINVDAPGSGYSQGDIVYWCTQEGRDCSDLVEWLATRDWSNGKVGMSGNSQVAMVQWFTAAEKPPHLTCIAPWEGTSDIYREFILWGGFPEVGFNEMLIRGRCGLGRIEDIIAMAREYPLMNAYWEDKIVRFDDIEIPAYVTAGWCHFHLRGSIEAFRQIASPKKWLRVHRDFEWPDAYTPEHIEDLRRFFDRYLKDIRNGWEMT
ncbi:CocE/NonD family hydrolase, partial [Chloroflexota bacterium]